MRETKIMLLSLLVSVAILYGTKSIVYNGLSGYWYFTTEVRTDDHGEKYLYVNDSVKVIYLKKDSLNCYKGEMVVLENNKVMADMFIEIIPNKWLMLDHLRSDYKEKLAERKRRMSNWLK